MPQVADLGIADSGTSGGPIPNLKTGIDSPAQNTSFSENSTFLGLFDRYPELLQVADLGIADSGTSGKQIEKTV